MQTSLGRKHKFQMIEKYEGMELWSSVKFDTEVDVVPEKYKGDLTSYLVDQLDITLAPEVESAIQSGADPHSHIIEYYR